MNPMQQAAAPNPTKKASCPICGTLFNWGIAGWDKHIASLNTHPKWRPDLKDPKSRKAAFKREYPDFFEQAAAIVAAAQRENQRRKNQRRFDQAERATKGRRVPGVLIDRAPVADSSQFGQLPQSSIESQTGRCPTCGGPVQVRYTAIQTEPMEALNGHQIEVKSP